MNLNANRSAIMNTPMKRSLYWTPRVLCLLFAAFISLFALDVFDHHLGFWHTLLALLIHLIPTFFLLLILAATWRWEWIGGVLFPALGTFYLVWAWGRFHWAAYVIVSGPLFLLGSLFLLGWALRAELRSRV